MSRWIEAMSAADRDVLRDAGRIGSARYEPSEWCPRCKYAMALHHRGIEWDGEIVETSCPSESQAREAFGR